MSLQMPIVQPAEQVRKYAHYFHNGFKNINQRMHFENYITGLMVLPNKDMANISRSILESPHKSNIARFMSESPWQRSEVNKARVAMINTETQAWKENHPLRAIIIDDTLNKHTGDLFEYVSWHYDHNNGQSELSHNLVSSYYVAGAVRFPIDCELYRQYDEFTAWEAVVRHLKPDLEIPKQGKARNRLREKLVAELLKADPIFVQKHAEFKTKIKIACDLIDSALTTHSLKPNIALFDSWFLSPALIERLNKHEVNWISILKKNRNLESNSFELKDAQGQPIRLSESLIQVQDLVKLIPPSAFKPVEIKDRTFYTFTFCVRIPTLGKVRLVISYQKADLSGTYVVLVTNGLNWNAKSIIEAYLLRWPIETFYQDGKQLLGLDQYQMLSSEAFQKHWCLVCVAHSLLHLDCLTATDKAAVFPAKSIGEACRQQAIGLLEHFVYFVQRFVADGLSSASVLAELFCKFLPNPNSKRRRLPRVIT
jgi:SRSO17 transposase